MKKYHVGCGIAGIYAGTFKQEGEWKKKSEVTDEAVAAVAQYLLSNRKGFKFNCNGTQYKIEIVEVLSPNV